LDETLKVRWIGLISSFRSNCLTHRDAEAPSGRAPEVGGQALQNNSCCPRLHCTEWSCVVLCSSSHRPNGSGRDWPYKATIRPCGRLPDGRSILAGRMLPGKLTFLGQPRRSGGSKGPVCSRLGLKLPEPSQCAEAWQKAILASPCDNKPRARSPSVNATRILIPPGSRRCISWATSSMTAVLPLRRFRHKRPGHGARGGAECRDGISFSRFRA
jgi:hypothetical protein